MEVDTDYSLVQATNEQTHLDDNVTLAYHLQEVEARVIEAIEFYAVPIICVLGLIGNSLSLVVFTRKALYNNSCSVFLAARSLSDNGFLATLLFLWTSTMFRLNLTQIIGACQTIIFLTYVFGCFSVWLVVLVTVENYIRICKPTLVTKYCTVRNAKVLSGLIFFAIILFYNFPFWTLSKECVPYSNRYDFVNGMIFTDVILTLVVPMVVMVALLLAVGNTAIRSNRRQRSSSVTIDGNSRPITKITRMLLAVTSIFFFLNMPSHAMRLKLAIQRYHNEQSSVSFFDHALQTASLLLYYTSLSINLVIYYKHGSRFRTVFREVILRRKNKERFRVKNMSTSKSRLTFRTSPVASLGSDTITERPVDSNIENEVFELYDLDNAPSEIGPKSGLMASVDQTCFNS